MAAEIKKTKDRLIETAMDLIWKSSYGAVSVDEICKAANVNKGSFYHHFPSKIDLTIATIDEAYNNFRPMMDSVFSPTIPPIQRLEKYTKIVYEHQKEIAEKYGKACGCPLMSLGCEMAPQNEAISVKTGEIIEHKLKYYETTLRDLVDEGLLPADTDIKSKSTQIHAFVIGQMTVARIENNLDPLKNDLKSGLFSMIGIEHNILEDT